MKPLSFGTTMVGEEPRVVGTISSRAALSRFASRPDDLPCDLVEVRLDLVGAHDAWQEACDRISTGRPVILTVRMKKEGGRWEGTEEERLAHYLAGLRHVAAVDAELASPLAPTVTAEARALGKPVILSHHDFSGTPPIEELRAILSRVAQVPHAVAKIATMVNDDDDLAILKQLLAEPRSIPICLLGMGARGGSTRVEFPRLGSCLTYGYLDQPVVPGQSSSEDLFRVLRAG